MTCHWVSICISCDIHVDFNFCQVTWSDIAGLDDVITDLKDTVILPIKKKHLFENSRLLQPPKGMFSVCICLRIKRVKKKIKFLLPIGTLFLEIRFLECQGSLNCFMKNIFFPET